MIRDTSAQDRPLAGPSVMRSWRRWVTRGVLAAAVVAELGLVLRGWLGAERSIDGARIRIARVGRGTLVRDVVADGRVVAANNPTLYAVAAGTVELHVRPGDQVARGQKLATIASPELQRRLAQEQATLAGLEGGVGRARLDIEAAYRDFLIRYSEEQRRAGRFERDVHRMARVVLPYGRARVSWTLNVGTGLSKTFEVAMSGLSGRVFPDIDLTLSTKPTELRVAIASFTSALACPAKQGHGAAVADFRRSSGCPSSARCQELTSGSPRQCPGANAEQVRAAATPPPDAASS